MIAREAHKSSAHLCLASIRRYFRSSSVCSAVFMLTNVVAMPVLPLRPVRPCKACQSRR